MTPESVGLEKEKIDPDALWIWGTLRDSDEKKFYKHNHSELLSGMTLLMRRDVYRLAPLVSKWLKKFEEELPHEKGNLRTDSPFAVGI